MARRNYNNGYGKKKRNRKPKFTEQEKFAYRYGQVMRGLKNPNSRITESFANGQIIKEKKKDKPLY